MFSFLKKPAFELQCLLSEEKLSNALDNLHFVLDIDDTLCSSIITKNKSEIQNYLAKLEKNGVNEKVIQVSFQQKKSGESGIALHVLHRGSVEFVQWIYTKLNSRVSFFSTRIKERDEFFIAEFISLALGVDGYERVKKAISVCSYDDLKECERSLENAKKKKFGLNHGNLKKDLTLTVDRDKNLDKTVYVSDDDSYVSPGQEKNSLIAWSTYGIDSFLMTEDCHLDDILRLNNIFYIVGILKRALDMTAIQGSFLDNLFNLQFKLNDDGVTYQPIHSLSISRLEFYRDGLFELQKINPNLEFYCSEYLYDLNRRQMLLDSELKSEIKNEMESVIKVETQLPVSLSILILSYVSFAWKYHDGLDRGLSEPILSTSRLSVFSSMKGGAEETSAPERQAASGALLKCSQSFN